MMTRTEIGCVCLVIAFAVYITLGIVRGAKPDKPNSHPQSMPVRVRVHLPSICAPLYDTGGDDWINCMLVEYK